MPAFNPDLLAALAVFAFVSSITPGPNNTMLLASGANFGVRCTLPHIAGVALGFPVLLMAVGFGLGAVFSAFPVLHVVLEVVGTAYLLWLAWKIATAKGLNAGPAKAAPQTFAQAAAFQWVNPKAWAMALGAVTAYTPRQDYAVGVVVTGLVFALVNLPCIACWTAFGAALRRFLDRPNILRVFNLTMAALLVASLYPVLADLWDRF